MNNGNSDPVDGNVDVDFLLDVSFLEECLGCNFDNNSQSFLSTTAVSSSDDAKQDVDDIEEPKDIQDLVSLLELTTPELTRPSLPPPASFHFPGKHHFNVNFDVNKVENNAVYSSSRDKLYVAKGMPCIVNFIVSSPVPRNTTLRVMAIFTNPEHANYNVHRCMNHALEDLKNGIEACDHIIKCENPQSVYVRNQHSLRRSILIPFNNPATGTFHSTYIFKFNCLTSCPGGLNRRPIRVIFTLENDRRVIIARRSVEVKICSSPWRDCSNDDKRVTTHSPVNTEDGFVVTSSKRRKIEKIDASITHVSDMFQYVDKVIHSTEKENDRSGKGPFTIVVHDREEYELLRQAKVLYEFVVFVRSLSPDRLDLLMGRRRSKKGKNKE